MKYSDAQLKANVTKFLKKEDACDDGRAFCKGKTAEQIWKEHAKEYKKNRSYHSETGLRWWYNHIVWQLPYPESSNLWKLREEFVNIGKPDTWRTMRKYFKSLKLAN